MIGSHTNAIVRPSSELAGYARRVAEPRGQFTPITAETVGVFCPSCNRSRTERAIQDARVRASQAPHCKCRTCGFKLPLGAGSALVLS